MNPYLMMMKRILLIFCVLSSLISNAQIIDEDTSDTYDWYPRQIGVRVGLNTTSYNASKNQLPNLEASSTPKMGWSVAASYWIPSSKLFLPRIEVSFEQLNTQVNYSRQFEDSSSYAFSGDTKVNRLSLAVIPELVFGRHTKYCLFVGFQGSLLLTAHQNGEETTIDPSRTLVTKVSFNKKNNSITEDIDTGFLFGGGFRHRFAERFLFHAETRFRFATTLVYEIYKPYYWTLSSGIIYQL